MSPEASFIPLSAAGSCRGCGRSELEEAVPADIQAAGAANLLWQAARAADDVVHASNLHPSEEDTVRLLRLRTGPERQYGTVTRICGQRIGNGICRTLGYDKNTAQLYRR